VTIALLQEDRTEAPLAPVAAGHHRGLLAEALRTMARDLRDHERQRAAEMGEVLDRTIEFLANRSGRCPTVQEVAIAAGVTVEEVLDGLEAAVADGDPRARRALAMRCEGYDRDAIAESLGVCRCAVSRLLRSALRPG
jgi:DNA-directed RNA polymerase specialized sigma subunit